MTVTELIVVVTLGVLGLVAFLTLFAIAATRVAQDADELAREHAAKIRAKRVAELESLYALPPREPRRVA